MIGRRRTVLPEKDVEFDNELGVLMLNGLVGLFAFLCFEKGFETL